MPWALRAADRHRASSPPRPARAISRPQAAAGVPRLRTRSGRSTRPNEGAALFFTFYSYDDDVDYESYVCSSNYRTRPVDARRWEHDGIRDFGICSGT